MCSQQETFNSMVLSHLNHFSLAGLLQFYRLMGSATAVLDHASHIRDVMPDASPRLVQALADTSEAKKRAEVEWQYDEAHQIQPLCMADERYPLRLTECDDAPLVVYYRGNADLNTRRVINVIGTRHATIYGKDLVHRFVTDLRKFCPDVLIVSGLAYGIDICAHRKALETGLPTVAVLAHGLDELYPNSHRETAIQMLQQGGLLTEFMTQTRADKRNFVQRNRIVAGMSDACVLVESAAKGGGLITASIARSYNREVFAFPGAVGAPYSEGCNQLIRDNGAALLTNAEDFVKAMGWEDDSILVKERQQGIERQMFPELSTDEQALVRVLSRTNDLQINMLATQANLPIHRVTALLFELEMKGVIKTLAGGACHLIQ